MGGFRAVSTSFHDPVLNMRLKINPLFYCERNSTSCTHTGTYQQLLTGTCNSAFTYSLELHAEVYYVRLNFNTTKLVYCSYLLVFIHNTWQNFNYLTYLWCLYLSHTPTIKRQIEDRFISPLRKVDSRRFNLKSRQQLQ